MVATHRFGVLALVLVACDAPSADNQVATGPGGASATTDAGAGGGVASSTSSGDFGFPGVGGSAPAPNGIVNDGKASSCLARPASCDSSPPVNSYASLDHLIAQCEKEISSPGSCGYVDVAFDAEGCATSFMPAGPVNNPELNACMVEHLNAERWLCAAALTVKWYSSCTIL